MNNEELVGSQNGNAICEAAGCFAKATDNIAVKVGPLGRFMEPHDLSLSSSPIPDHNTWTVTMWHFGKDSLSEYTGEKFEITWEEGENALMRAYTKDLKDGKGIRIRTEGQEYPNKSFGEAIEGKLSIVGP